MVLLLASCSVPSDEPTPALASVEDAVITVDDFERTYVAFLINTGANDTPRNRYRHLNSLVDTHLLAEEARQRALDRDSAYLAFAERARKKAVGGRFYERVFLETLAPLTETEIRQAFARYKEQVVVRHLIYRHEADAQAAYERLQAGRDFINEAQDCYGLVEYDSLAGYLGPIRYFQMDDAFAETAFALDVGAYSAPVRSRYGFHIIRVEDRLVNPILTESEYQTRKAGIASQLRLRKRRLEGDVFVRTFMDALDVQVDPAGIKALSLALQDLEHRAGPEPISVASSGELTQHGLGELRASLAPDTPLATYSLQGKPHLFTALDYYFWLEELPFAEARQRTAASVGRALRNEVFAQAGREQGLDRDPQALHEIENQQRIYLASALQNQLREQAAEAPLDETFLRVAYDNLGLDQRKRTSADFWLVPFPSREAAEQAKERLRSTPQQFMMYEGAKAYSEQDLQGVPEWRSYVMRAPLGQVALVGLPDNEWTLLFVSHRTATSLSFEESKTHLAQKLGPLASEFHLLQDLRVEASVEVDTLLFEQIMARQ